MPRGQGETPHRSLRVNDPLWDAAKRVAADRGESLNALIVRLLQRAVDEHPLDED